MLEEYSIGYFNYRFWRQILDQHSNGKWKFGAENGVFIS